MKSLVISLGGTKAARIADIFAYYTSKLDSRLYVEVFDTKGKALPDATVKITKKEIPPEKPEQVMTGAPVLIPYLLEVSKQGYESVREVVEVKPEQISTVQVTLAKERTFFLLTTVFLTLLAPFLWALLMYAGILLGNPLADYLSLSILIFFAQLGGAFAGLKTVGARIEAVIKNRYFSGVIGIITGEFIAILGCNFVLGYLLGAVGFIRDLFGGYALAGQDIGIIVIFMVILAIAGLLIDQHVLPRLNKNWITTSMVVAFGAMLGGLFSYFYLSRIARLVNILTLSPQGVDVSTFFPFIVLGFTLLWCYGVMYFLKKRGLILDNANLYEAVFSILGVMLISVMLPLLFGKATILVPFAGGSVSGAISGLIAYFLLFGGLSTKSGIKSITEGDILIKQYQLQTTSFIVDTIRSRLENLKFISPDCIHYINEPKRDAASFFNTDLKDQIRKKINGIYRKNLEGCSRLFSSFVVIADLRNNNLCEIFPLVLAFLREEYSIPVYAVVISTEQKINRNWMKKVIEKSDAVFPVDYQLFDDVLYLDRFFYQNGGELKNEEIYEEGCVVELIRRIAPLLEIGERHSPSGLDVSHVNRLLSRNRMPVTNCNEIPDVIPPSSQNVATFGYFLLHTDKCRNFNLELGMGEYLEFALRHPLWRMERSGKSTRALVIVRGKRELVKVGLVRTWMQDLYDGPVIVTGDLLTESSDTLEIIILISHILNDVAEDPGAGGGCSENIPDSPVSPGVFRKYWNDLIKKEKPEIEETGERFRYGTIDAYTNIVKKYYNRSPLIRYRAVTLARPYPGAQNWEQAKAICEWVRDNISYVSDPLDSEYIQLPEETLNNGGGDCDDQAVILASLLMCVGFRCALVTLPKHIYAAVHAPDAPGNVRTYKDKAWPDGTSARDWIGFDPTCTNCRFGELPEDDINNINAIAIIG
ncbi:MAG: transglutaminase domain-containing protein [bacterium]